MSEKWTKGPWEIREYKDPYGRREVAVEIMKDDMIIAKLGIETDPECEANKHLIAAAPDMYEMLMHIKDKVLYPMSHMGGDFAMFGEGFGIATNELLKKARGES
jgi:hypothetical protein